MARGQAVKHVHEERLDDVEHLKVVLVDRHLKVEPRELAHVAVRVRVLRAEDGADLEDAVEVGADRHLLRQLRRLREARGAAHVVEAEDGGAALGRARDELGRVDLLEAALQERLAEELRDRRLHAEDRLVGGRAQVDDAVVEAHVLADGHERLALGGGGGDLGLVMVGGRGWG